MGTEPADDFAAFAGVMEQIERQNAQRLFYDLFPNNDKQRDDGSVRRRRGRRGGVGVEGTDRAGR